MGPRRPPPGLTGQALARWRVQKPDTVTVTRDGRQVTLTGEALVRWKYQRYMQDYLATVQSVDESVGKDQWELFDLVHDPYELHNLYGQPGTESLTVSLKAELARLKRAVGDNDQLADVQLPNGVDGTVARPRGR